MEAGSRTDPDGSNMNQDMLVTEEFITLEKKDQSSVNFSQ